MSDHSCGRVYRVPQGEGIATDPVADQVLLTALEGVDLDATPAAILLLSKQVVDALDPITLLGHAGTPFGRLSQTRSPSSRERGKTMTQGRFTYSITRTDPDGRWVRNELRLDQGRWTLWRSTDTTTRSFPVDLNTTDPIEVIAVTPVLHRIGTEITEIFFNARISNHDLLGVLRVDRPSAPAPDPERWVDDVEDWAMQDEWITRGSVPEGSTILPRWISINAQRAAVLRDRRRSAVVLFDADFEAPPTGTRIIPRRWSPVTATPSHPKDESIRTPLLYPPRREEEEQGLHRYPPKQGLAESYRTQWYRLRGQHDLHPADQTTGAFPFDHPVHLITAWNPLGDAKTREAKETAQDGLRDGLEDNVVSTMATVAAELEWVEGVLIVVGLTDERAIDIAAELGQVAVVRWDSESLTTLPTGLGAIPRVRTGWRLSRPMSLCPMQVSGSGVCKPEGGPWVSRSIEVALVWQTHRDLALDLFGCTVCEDGSLPIGGPGGHAIGLVEVLLASRHGGYQFGDHADP